LSEPPPRLMRAPGQLVKRMGMIWPDTRGQGSRRHGWKHSFLRVLGSARFDRQTRGQESGGLEAFVFQGCGRAAPYICTDLARILHGCCTGVRSLRRERCTVHAQRQVVRARVLLAEAIGPVRALFRCECGSPCSCAPRCCFCTDSARVHVTSTRRRASRLCVGPVRSLDWAFCSHRSTSHAQPPVVAGLPLGSLWWRTHVRPEVSGRIARYCPACVPMAGHRVRHVRSR
jgi:hypothetical protein